MKYRTITLTLISLASSPSIFAQVQNGDFEQWSGTAPTAWTVIDSGISVTPSSTQINSGGLSAQVNVTTATQSNTDFLQTLSVEQGQTYPFSVAIYHTKGHIKARLFVDGYQNYSDPTKTSQWQELSYVYTAEANKDIQVGLRFYDIAGFDGSEVVYIDRFLPSSTNEPLPPTCQEHSLTLSLTTDQYGSETSWAIKDANSNPVSSGDSYASSTSYNTSICLADGDYQFTITDSHGDGICCNSGSGSYSLSYGQTVIASGGEFAHNQSTSFTLGQSKPNDEYYKTAYGKSGFELKTALYEIIKNHDSKGYDAIWNLVNTTDLDNYYEKDGSILDIYSEKPETSDSVKYNKVSNQCGQYRQEGDCYNREHAFPKIWFGGKVEPMNSDAHHLFATDGYVNSRRSNWPFGEVGNATYVSSNGSKLGNANATLGYSGTVFEPIDEFKGDLARAYFYMATRYENVIATWQYNSTNSNASLDGTNSTVFEPWLLTMLKRWHKEDPVSAKEVSRNQAVFEFQGNRNPFVDHPEYVTQIWGN